ncbi:hypothetical protein SARC_06070 [Sphaeroforma arctica JP610]|uniref:Uncharacterized protein n=1 Tax=Sphaeroforma arctica JP610 TaxID=667725 RepID=A0A0L0FYC1_9EUKA|nr:hypothetical protein SARC_06070 [Sphaeroforma arctica JP610]KNC81614.1 hypothetical protein SARC_06070 [Sphaeroforma arctica JP610]|eukprot:XP_014155516.1 hypothetical protein SARC_06070 [Sphaeroforma arctica JP610]
MAAFLILGAVFVAKQIKEELDSDDVKEDRRRLRVVEKRIRTPIEGHVTFSIEKREMERKKIEAQILRPSKVTRRVRRMQSREERKGVQERRTPLGSGSFALGSDEYITLQTAEYVHAFEAHTGEKRPARLTPIPLLE